MVYFEVEDNSQYFLLLGERKPVSNNYCTAKQNSQHIIAALDTSNMSKYNDD